MGERETILLVEGNVHRQAAVSGLLQDEGHTVVARATILPDLREILDGSEQFRIAIISGRLPAGFGDGAVAASMVRHERPGTIIISHSADRQTFGDFNVDKTSPLYPQELTDIVLGIPPRV